MNESLLRAYSEVDKILSFMETEYVEKIPQKLREVFKNEKLKDYNPEISKDIPLNEQALERKTYEILAMLDLNYWCQDEEEKKEVLIAYSNNDKIEEKELEKYNIECIFDNIKNIEKNKKSIMPVKYVKETYFKKILNKIRKMFRK